jgi:coenzyme F420-dependent glucose-6-phosphate dehydrogenase
MSEQNGKVVGAEAVRQSVCISADAEDHIRHAEKYIDLGFDHLIFHSAGPDQLAFIDNYGKHVLPRLREKWQGTACSAAALEI